MESLVTSTDSMNFTDDVEEGLYNMTKSAGAEKTPEHDIPERFRISWDDATWVLTASFIIFTMQSGFGLLEAGCVNSKNEVNILVKNAIDVVFGGITYWMFGYGLSFGMDKGTNSFFGVGYWFVEDNDRDTMGAVYATFIFQLSFATTATTIVSGAMAERTKLRSYIVFSLLNTVIYCIPAHWVWAENGFLATFGVIDVAGSGVVHLLGGVSSFVAAAMLGPRTGRYDSGFKRLPLGNGTTTLLGMFMLWWGWLAFNSGSTFGISGGKWILAARSSVTTLNSSMGGGVVGIIYTCMVNKGKILVTDLNTSILGALVSITAGCALVKPWEAVVIGAVGALLCLVSVDLIDRMHVDDPVSAVAVHATGGAWGMLAVGFFVDIDRLEDFSGGLKGVNYGGGFYLLGVQTLAIVCITAWSTVSTYVILALIRCVMGLRMSLHEEELGSDYVEHAIPRIQKNMYARLQQEFGLLGLTNGVDKSISVLICQLHNISKENQQKLRVLRPSDTTPQHHQQGDANGNINGVGNHIPDTDMLHSERL